jgi:DNA-directed RNA polymerase beta' subunit
MKEGVIRCNIMGKRVNQSSRSVIGPDPTLKIGEMAVPISVAETLTIPEYVNKHNIDELTKLMYNGKINFYTKNCTKNRINLKYALKNNSNIKLEIGDICERQLRNNDRVILNRQPTLHTGSMVAHKVVIRPYSTFRMPLAVTSQFNADFDGDRSCPQQVATSMCC